MEWISDNAFFLPAERNGALMLLTDGRDQVFGSSSMLSRHWNTEHVPWGNRDDQPNQMARLLQNNNQVRPLLEACRDMIHGSGIGFFEQVLDGKTVHLEPFMDDRLQEWCYETELANYVISAINERVTNANHFTRFQFKLDGTPLLSISDSFTTRIGRPVNGKVVEYHQNPFFGESLSLPVKSTKIPAFDRNAPTRFVVSIMHSREHISGNPYYAFPSWWCARDWIEVANMIPLFHRSGLQNGYNLKYLIKMPKDYFDKEGGKDLEPKAIQKKWAEFGENLKKWLSGVDNVNKSMLIRYLRDDQTGKPLDSIDVVPMKNEASDDLYAKISELSAVNISNAVGLLPVLGGVTPGSKSGDSGSQVRVVADYQQHFRTPVQRQIVLEPIRQALRIMGYKNIVPAFKEIQLTTLDKNPNGKEAVVNHGAA